MSEGLDLDDGVGIGADRAVDVDVGVVWCAVLWRGGGCGGMKM